jgi:hypothetical protein
MKRRTNLIAMLALLSPLPIMYLALWIAMAIVYLVTGEAKAQRIVSNDFVYYAFRLVFYMFFSGLCLGIVFWFNAMLPVTRKLTGDTEYFRSGVRSVQRVGLLWRDSEFRQAESTAVE